MVPDTIRGHFDGFCPRGVDSIGISWVLNQQVPVTR